MNDTNRGGPEKRWMKASGLGWSFYVEDREAAAGIILMLRAYARPRGRGKASRRQMPKAGLEACRNLWAPGVSA